MEKRYYPLSKYLQKTYGKKVYKITLDAGLYCPNRDGTISRGGCIFCDDKGSYSRCLDKKLTIAQQINKSIIKLSDQFKAEAFIAYFQSFSNTYSDIKTLEKIYSSAFCDNRIVGISIGTRPDCVDSEKLDLIASYKNPTIEYGIQSANDETLKLINRGHDFACFKNAVIETKKRNIRVCAHMILGFENENRQMIINSAKKIAKLGIDAIKIHMLTVLKDAPLYQLYKEKPFYLMTQEQYCDLVTEILEYMPGNTVIERIAGTGYSETTIEPKWVNRRFEILNMIDRIMIQKNIYQSDKYCDINIKGN